MIILIVERNRQRAREGQNAHFAEYYRQLREEQISWFPHVREGCRGPFRVNLVVPTVGGPLPVHPDNRTFSDSGEMSQRCQERRRGRFATAVAPATGLIYRNDALLFGAYVVTSIWRRSEVSRDYPRQHARQAAFRRRTIDPYVRRLAQAPAGA